MLRILVVNYRDIEHPEAGGAEVHLHRIFGRLVAQGHAVCLLTTSFPGAPERTVIDGIQVIRHGGDLTFQWTVRRMLPRIEADFRPDVLVEDLNKLPLYTEQCSKLPKLIQIHHLWMSSIFREASFPIALAVWAFEKSIPLFYRNSAFAVVSPSTSIELTRLGIAEDRISLIYNGTETELQASSPAPKKPYFLWLGRIRRYKGIWVALEAFREFARRNHEGHLIFAGSGPESAALAKKVHQWGLSERVEIAGRVSKERKAELLREATALLQTSYKEGWGLTVIEAAGQGTTTIASNVAGLRDSVLDGKTGLLFPAGNALACAHAMENLVRTPQLRQSLESAALEHARTFSWDRAAQETLQCLQNLLEKASNR